MEPEAQTAPSPANGLNSHHGHEGAFVSPAVVSPSDFLRHRTLSRPVTPAAPQPSKPEKPIDRDEREALVSRTLFREDQQRGTSRKTQTIGAAIPFPRPATDRSDASRLED